MKKYVILKKIRLRFGYFYVWLIFHWNFTTLTAALLQRQLSYSQSPLLRAWPTLGKVHPLTSQQTCAEHASSACILWLGSYPNQHGRVSFDLPAPCLSLSNKFLSLTDCDFLLCFPKRLHESLSRCYYFLPINTSTKKRVNLPSFLYSVSSRARDGAPVYNVATFRYQNTVEY